MARNKKSIQAEEDWLRGDTLKKIAEKYRVTIDQVRAWYRSYDWSKKRKEFNKRRDSSLFDRLLKEGEEYSRANMRRGKRLAKIFDQAIDQLEKRAKGEEIEPLPGSVVKDLADYVNILRKLSGLHRDVIPDFNDQIGGKIVSELQERDTEVEDGP